MYILQPQQQFNGNGMGGSMGYGYNMGYGNYYPGYGQQQQGYNMQGYSGYGYQYGFVLYVEQNKKQTLNQGLAKSVLVVNNVME